MGYLFARRTPRQRPDSSRSYSAYLFVTVACLLLGLTNAANPTETPATAAAAAATTTDDPGFLKRMFNNVKSSWSNTIEQSVNNSTALNDSVNQNESSNATAILTKHPSDVQMYLSAFLSLLAQLFIVFGGIIPYIPQYSIIKRTQNAEGFSNYVCLTLLVANILRIEFWFGKRFEIPLLLQSIVMIFCMLIMLEMWTRVHAKSLRLRVPSDVEIITISKEQLTDEIVEMRFTDFKVNYFWRWTKFTSYLQFLFLLTLFLSIVTWALIKNTVYIETIGFMAVLFEALLGIPQFLRNLRLKSTEGMSVKMVLLWASGDIFKTVYFILRNAPKQFWICGILQISIDVAILGQVLLYSNKYEFRQQ